MKTNQFECVNCGCRLETHPIPECKKFVPKYPTPLQPSKEEPESKEWEKELSKFYGCMFESGDFDDLVFFIRSEKKKSEDFGFEKAKDMIHIGDYYTNGLIDGKYHAKEEMKKEIIDWVSNKWEGSGDDLINYLKSKK